MIGSEATILSRRPKPWTTPTKRVRLAAGWGLAQMGDAGSVDALLKAADVKPGWERIQATKHCFVLAERLKAAGRKDLAQKIYQHLRDTRKDAGQEYIGDAAKAAEG